MALSCCRNGLRRTLQTTEEKRKHRIESDRARRAAKTAEQKKVSKPRREKIEQGMLLV